MRPGFCGGRFVASIVVPGNEFSKGLGMMPTSFVIFVHPALIVCHKKSADRICNNVTLQVARRSLEQVVLREPDCPGGVVAESGARE
jgi:hypothetical protein